MAILHNKVEQLRTILRELGSVAVAYSGGLDSAFLLKVAHEELGEKALGILGVSPSVPEREIRDAQAFASQQGLPLLRIETREFEDPDYLRNTPDRCYYCKTTLFEDCRRVAREKGLVHVLDGCNASDVGDYRPGRRAAREAGVRSPLLEANLSKEEIREAAREMGLPIWDKPSFACLGSRFPYGQEISPEKARTIEQCENLLRDLGFRQFRVRYHGPVARIEVEPPDFQRILEHRDKIVPFFTKQGFQYVSLDLEGYRTGSLNREILKDPDQDIA